MSVPPLTCATLRVAEALAKSQALGEEGDVDQALMLSQQAEAYKKQHEELYKRLSTPDRIMTVCEICGVFINSTDNDARKLVRAASESGGVSRREAAADRGAVCVRKCLTPRVMTGRQDPAANPGEGMMML